MIPLKMVNRLGQFHFPGPKSVYTDTVNSGIPAVPSGKALTGVSFGYNEALRWLEDAEKVVAASPSCDLPIVAAFRNFVAGAGGPQGQLNARFDLGPVDMDNLAQFNQCIQSSKTLSDVQAKAAADKAAADRQQMIIYGAVGGTLLLGAGYLAYRLW